MKPFRLEFSTVGLVPEETYVQQAVDNIAAGWPEIRAVAPHDIPLAIVGGGPSAGAHLQELKEWKGHVWGINQSASWLSHMAPKALTWMFSVDPDEQLALPQYTCGVQRAILGSSCHPKLFEALRGKDVQLFHTRIVPGVEELKADDGSEVEPVETNLMGPSSVCRTFLPAAMLGYADVTYFGCEGSIGDSTHAYRNEDRPRQMVIRAGDRDYITTPDYYITTKFLVSIMQEYPLLKEKSGGLLRAMLQHPETWEVVALSEALRDLLDPTAKDSYVPRIAA